MSIELNEGVELESESLGKLKNFIRENSSRIRFALKLVKKHSFDTIILRVMDEEKPAILTGEIKTDNDKIWRGTFKVIIRITKEAEAVTENPDYLLGKSKRKWLKIGKLAIEPETEHPGFCIFCGAELLPVATFCHNCGSAIEH